MAKCNGCGRDMRAEFLTPIVAAEYSSTEHGDSYLRLDREEVKGMGLPNGYYCDDCGNNALAYHRAVYHMALNWHARVSYPEFTPRQVESLRLFAKHWREAHAAHVEAGRR